MFKIFYIRKESGTYYLSGYRYDLYEVDPTKVFTTETQVKNEIERIKDEFDNVKGIYLVDTTTMVARTMEGNMFDRAIRHFKEEKITIKEERKDNGTNFKF